MRDKESVKRRKVKEVKGYEVDSVMRREKTDEVVRVTLRLDVCRQSDRLGVKPLRPTTSIFFQLNSLTRGWVCRLQLLLVLASAVIVGSESHGTHDHILCLRFETPNMEGQVPVFISSRNRVAQLCPHPLGSLFVASYDSQKGFEPASTRDSPDEA
jgi:hypothetical protein